MKQHDLILAVTTFQAFAQGLLDWIAELPDYQRDQFVPKGSFYGTSYIFVLLPDGATEGTPESEEFNKLRGALLQRLQTDNFASGESPWKWAAFTLGECGAHTVCTNCEELLRGDLT